MDFDAAAFSERISEIKTWIAAQELTAVHQDSPDQARRRLLLEEASRLLRTARYPGESWLKRSLPSGRRWTRAMDLLKHADPDSLAPLEHQLRSPVLKPPDSIGSFISEATRSEIVNRLIYLRSSLVQSTGGTLSLDCGQGKILLYTPCENVSDGASRFASSGFFDPNDCPPWDTWLHYSDRTLLSYGPEMLIPLAQAGIDANAVDCIKWANELKCP